MDTEVVLMQDIDGLGKRGDKVRVARGYARNYLFPKKVAAPATEKYIKVLEVEERRKKSAAKRAVDDLRGIAEELNQTSYTIPMQAGEDGKLFGSVTTQHIADSLKEAGFDIDKRSISLPEHIKELGVYTVEVKLDHEITASVKVWVVEK